MNKEFHDIIERIHDLKDMEVMLIGSRVSIPALIALNARLERLELLLIPKTIKEEQL